MRREMIVSAIYTQLYKLTDEQLSHLLIQLTSHVKEGFHE